MSETNRRQIGSVVAWSIAVWLIAITTMLYADAAVVPGPTDSILTVMQAAGFPAWAGVVAWGVVKVSSEMRRISEKLDAFAMQIERRLARVEARIELADAVSVAPKDYAP